MDDEARSRILDHLERPRHPGRIPEADGESEAVNPACGDRVFISLRLDGDRILEARFLAEGCPETLASASALMERIPGLSASDLEALGEEDLSGWLGGLPGDRRHAAEVALRAARQAMRLAMQPRRGSRPSLRAS